MFLLFIFCFSSSDNSPIELNEDSKLDAIIHQIKNGKKFSEIVDVEKIVHEYPSIKYLLIAIDEIEFPQNSCYIDVISRLNVDCNNANEDQQKYLAIQFTQCYYNITNRLNEFPCDADDSKKIQFMSGPVYGTYVTMKTHWRNLCHFAKQSMFNEETAKQLVGLIKSVVESSNAIKDMNQAMNESTQQLNISVHNITKKLESGKIFLTNIGTQILKFNATIKSMTEVIMKPLEHIENVKIFFLMFIIIIFIGMFLPEILIPLILVTIVFYAFDRNIMKKYDWWANSYKRIILKVLYVLISISYPCYKIYKNTLTISSFLLKILHLKKPKPKVLPRFGKVQQLKHKTRIRGY